MLLADWILTDPFGSVFSPEGSGLWGIQRLVLKKVHIPTTHRWRVLLSVWFQVTWWCYCLPGKKILAIMEACRWLSGIRARETVGILADSQTALISLSSYITSSILVGQCNKELLMLRFQSQVTLVWVPVIETFTAMKGQTSWQGQNLP